MIWSYVVALLVCCWSVVVEANGQFSLTQRKVAAQLAAMLPEATILVFERTHQDIFRQRMQREGIEPSERLIIEALDEVNELYTREHQDLTALDQNTGWLAKTAGKILTLGLKVKFGWAKKKSRIFEKKRTPLFSEISEETFIWLMAMIDQQKHGAKARMVQFQQATRNPDAIDHSMLSHENFIRLYLEQLSEHDLDILINHLKTQESIPTLDENR